MKHKECSSAQTVEGGGLNILPSTTGAEEVINFLATTKYRRILGFTPLPVSDAVFNLPKYLHQGIETGVLPVEQLPSAFFHNDTRNFTGRVEPAGVTLSDPDLRMLAIPERYRDPRSMTVFRTRKRLYALGGQELITAERIYTLYLASQNFPPTLLERYSEPLRKYYGIDLTASQRRILWFNTCPVDFKRVAGTIFAYNKETFRAVGTAKDLERFNKDHPTSAGLPSLGKDR